LPVAVVVVVETPAQTAMAEAALVVLFMLNIFQLLPAAPFLIM
jgi:hypothetical protein